MTSSEGNGSTLLEAQDSLQEVPLEDSLVENLEQMARDVSEEEEIVSEITEVEENEPIQTGEATVEGGHKEQRASTPAEATSLGVGSLIHNKEFEEAATLAAAVTREAAAAAQESFLKASSEAKNFFGALWGSLDTPGASSTRDKESKSYGSIDIQKRFSIEDESEKILESFRCKLIQQYVASNNSFTKPKSIGFSGIFHILDNYVAFEFDNLSNGKPVVIPDKDIKQFKESDGVIVLSLTGTRTFVVGHFTYGVMEVESAMNLLHRKRTSGDTS